MSTVRLVAEAGPTDGSYDAGVDLAMAPGSHTYWKMPGEAGVPPVFTFNGSENVRSAIVRYPVPQRITEEGIDAFGYADRVVFPVRVTPVDPAKPVRLRADVTYAVCNRICLPGHAEAELELRPHAAGSAPGLVRDALAQVPRAADDAAALLVAPAGGGGEPSWTLRWSGVAPPRDIFPDAPEGYSFTTRRTAGEGAPAWTLTATTSVAAPHAASVPVTLVLAGANGATEVTRVLDLHAADR